MIKIFYKKNLLRYLRGDGVEIGALHKPLPLTGSKINKIRYVDRMTNEDLRKHYPELNELPLVEVDIVDDGSTLSTIADESLDFIIANNLIEHLENPIRALENWHAKLKAGGIIYMAVPNKRHTFDKDRSLTTIEHLVGDYTASKDMLEKRNFYHFVETAEIIEKRVGKDAEERVIDLINRDYSIHHHTWDYRSFKAFLNYVISTMKISYAIVDSSSTDWITKEFVFILRKI